MAPQINRAAISGIEVYALVLGDADCILVRAWTGNAPYCLLVDGGKAGHAKEVREFLRSRSIGHLHSIVCTHGHDDHAGGLIELLEDETLSVGEIAYHDPRDYVGEDAIKDALRKAAGTTEADVIRKTLDTVSELGRIVARRRITRISPFRGDFIGFLQVLGPSPEFYRTLVTEFADAEQIRRASAIYGNLPNRQRDPDLESSSLDDEPETSPVNESSIVLGEVLVNQTFMFTGDAGVKALGQVASYYADSIRNVDYMQIPHHGSRNNINPALISHFRPKKAFVCARQAGGHPSVAVVNALKNVNARVYSTGYHVASWLRYYQGNVPTVPGSAVPELWEAQEDIQRRMAAASPIPVVPAFKR